MKTDKNIIIIGGGVAGLSAGIYGQMNGFSTTLFEMHSVAGGQCTAWKRKDYTFDYCIHWLVGSSSGAFNTIWKETDALNDRVRIVNHVTYATLIDEKGEEFIIYSSIDRWEQYLLEKAPEDGAAIRKMCADMRKMSYLDLFENEAGSRSLAEYFRMLLKSRKALVMMGRYGRQSTRQYFDSLRLKNEWLRTNLNRAMGDGAFSAIAFLMTLAWFSNNNAGYPLGGSLPFAQRMAERYRQLGGELRLKTRVEKILVKEGRAIGVRLEDGSEYLADYVISAADLHATMYGMLDGKYVPAEVDKAFKQWPLFNPVIQVSFGISVPVSTRYHMIRYTAPGNNLGSTALKDGFSLADYNFDPVITPEGKCVMKMLVESPWELWEGMSREEYQEEKKRIAEDAVKLLLSVHPEVEGHIEVVDVATPRTGARYTGVYRGSYEGFLPTKENIGKNLKMEVPGLKNFYQIGQWAFPGGGLPPSVQSGKWVIQKIRKKAAK